MNCVMRSLGEQIERELDHQEDLEPIEVFQERGVIRDADGRVVDPAVLGGRPCANHMLAWAHESFNPMEGFK